MLSSMRLHRAGSSVASRSSACRQPARHTQHAILRQHPRRPVAVASAPGDPPPSPTPEEEEDYLQDFEGLLPEEDFEVPGGMPEALNPNTKLGKAVKAACAELEHLNNLEADLMQEYNNKLKALGIPIDIFNMPAAPAEPEGTDATSTEGSGTGSSSDPSS